MGYHIHHAIVLNSFDEQSIDEAHQLAMGIFGSQTSNIVSSPVNGFKSFFIAPDGSKENWEESENGNAKREALKNALRVKNGYVDWVEVAFGGDEPEYNTKVVDHDSYEERGK